MLSKFRESTKFFNTLLILSGPAFPIYALKKYELLTDEQAELIGSSWLLFCMIVALLEFLLAVNWLRLFRKLWTAGKKLFSSCRSRR